MKEKIIITNITIEKVDSHLDFGSETKVTLNHDRGIVLGHCDIFKQDGEIRADFELDADAVNDNFTPEARVFPSIGYNKNTETITEVALCTDPKGNVDETIEWFNIIE